jgi:hypothetical protein
MHLDKVGDRTNCPVSAEAGKRQRFQKCQDKYPLHFGSQEKND